MSIAGPEGAVPTLVMDPTAVTSTGGPGDRDLSRQRRTGAGLHPRATGREHLRARGNRVIIPEYRGYGEHGGRAEPEGDRRRHGRGGRLDQQAAVVRQVEGRLLRVVARAGGGLPARRNTTPAGLVLQSPFKSVTSFAWGFGVPPFLVKHPFRNDLVLEKLDVPVLIIHGTQDSVVPVARAGAARRSRRRCTYVELQGDHFHDWAD